MTSKPANSARVWTRYVAGAGRALLGLLVFAVGVAVVGLPIAILVAGLALIPAALGARKGQPPFEWWLFGFLLLPVALVAVLFVSARRARCPHCAEPVRQEASVCPHCRRSLSSAWPVASGYR